MDNQNRITLFIEKIKSFHLFSIETFRSLPNIFTPFKIFNGIRAKPHDSIHTSQNWWRVNFESGAHRTLIPGTAWALTGPQPRWLPLLRCLPGWLHYRTPASSWTARGEAAAASRLSEGSATPHPFLPASWAETSRGHWVQLQVPAFGKKRQNSLVWSAWSIPNSSQRCQCYWSKDRTLSSERLAI